MRHFYFFLSTMAVTASIAQPTIQQAHLPQAGHVLVAYSDTVGGPAYLPTPPGAAAQTWNYAGLNPHESHGLISHPPAGLPGAAMFPDATFAWGDPDAGGDEYWYTFYRSGPAGLEILGEVGGWPDGSVHGSNENYIEIPVPFTYGTTIDQTITETTVFTSGVGPQSSATMYRSHRMRTLTGDAHGTMITPAYPAGVSVVRMRSLQTSSVDSIFLSEGGMPWEFLFTYDQGVSEPDYIFLQAANPVYVAFVESEAEYITYFGSSITGSEEASRPSNSMVYPNPGNGPITIVPGDVRAERLEVLDALGRWISTYYIQGADRIVMDSSSWAEGSYIYRCLDGHGTVVAQGGFMIAH